MKPYRFLRIGFVLMVIGLTACATTEGGKNDGKSAEQMKAEAAAARNLGEAHMGEGNLTAALRQFKKAEKLYPDDHFLQYDIGLVYLAKEKYDLAILHFEKAIEINPDYAPAMNSLGNAYLGKKDWEKAIYYFEEVSNNLLYATPQYPLAGMGLAYYNQGEYKEAEKYYLEALSLSPKFDSALVGLARTYLAQGRIPAAIEKLEKAVDFYPESPLIRYELAKAYRIAGNHQRARMEYDNVIRLAPNTPLADEAEKEAKVLK